LASNPQDSHYVTIVVLVRGSKAPPLTPSVRRNKIKMANHDDSHVFILSAQFFLAGAKKKVFQTEALP